MALPETCSAGGPIIAIPAELAAAWRGTLPPRGVEAPKDWSWGNGDIICDYDDACDNVRDSISTEYGGVGWLPVGDGRALILDRELATAFLSTATGGVILRNYEDQLDRAAAEQLTAAIPLDDWQRLAQTLKLVDGRMFLFDSACAGAAEPDEIEAYDGVVVADLGPGRYRIEVAVDGGMDLIRLTRD